MKVNEVVQGQSAEAIVTAMQQRVAKEANFLVSAVVRSMTPLKFAQEVTRRYNTALKDSVPIPATCDDFLRVGAEKGFATVLDADRGGG